MKIKTVIILISLILAVVAILLTLAPTPTPPVTPILTIVKTELVEPVAEFKKRITKKPFGIYITPASSPITPEKFTGYHTGVDVEYEDIVSDVPVKAIADGVVEISEYASGYGGVMVIKHKISGRSVFALYGHLRPASMLETGVEVTTEEEIGVLGKGYTGETSGERKHLHFGLAVSSDIRGYVSSKEELNSIWLNPLSLYL